MLVMPLPLFTILSSDTRVGPPAGPPATPPVGPSTLETSVEPDEVPSAAASVSVRTSVRQPKLTPPSHNTQVKRLFGKLVEQIGESIKHD